MDQPDSPLLHGPILPALLAFAGPVLLALLLQALYGAVDLWAVGQFCTPAEVSAVATGSQAMLILTGVITGLSMGTTVLLGQKIGEGSGSGAARVLGTSIALFAALGLLLTAVALAGAVPIAVWMHAPEESFSATVCYLRICGAGTFCIVGYNVLTAVFRGMGNARAPLVFVFIACVANIAGDLLLVGLFRLDAAGAAMATAAAQAVSVGLSLLWIRRTGLPFPFRKADLRPDPPTLRHILRLGLPIALQDTCNELSYLILIGLVNTLGVTASAGVGIAERLVMFILLVPTAYMSSLSAFTAQNAGAGQMSRARTALFRGMATAAVLGGAIAAVAFCFGQPLSMIFIRDPQVTAASAEFLRATAIECFLLSLAGCLTGYFNGLGHTAFVMAQGLGAIFLVRIPFAVFAAGQPEPSLFAIGLSTALSAGSSLLTCLLFDRVRKPGQPH